MLRDDVITLVREKPGAHGVFDKPTEEQCEVFCRVQSVSRSEFWRAKENGLEPQFIFTLSEYVDYHGEKIVLYHGKRYRVIRSYVKDHKTELEVGEVTADA